MGKVLGMRAKRMREVGDEAAVRQALTALVSGHAIKKMARIPKLRKVPAIAAIALTMNQLIKCFFQTNSPVQEPIFPLQKAFYHNLP